MRSRGIPFSEYKRIITRSYLEKIINSIENVEITSFIKEKQEKLEKERLEKEKKEKEKQDKLEKEQKES